MFGSLMGIIQHKVVNPMHDPFEKYCVFDSFGNLMAESKQQDEIDKKLTLFSNDNQKAFSMKRSLNKLKDHWTIEMGPGIDKRLAIFIPIYVSSEDGK